MITSLGTTALSSHSFLTLFTIDYDLPLPPHKTTLHSFLTPWLWSLCHDDRFHFVLNRSIPFEFAFTFYGSLLAFAFTFYGSLLAFSFSQSHILRFYPRILFALSHTKSHQFKVIFKVFWFCYILYVNNHFSFITRTSKKINIRKTKVNKFIN